MDFDDFVKSAPIEASPLSRAARGRRGDSDDDDDAPDFGDSRSGSTSSRRYEDENSSPQNANERHKRSDSSSRVLVSPAYATRFQQQPQTPRKYASNSLKRQKEGNPEQVHENQASTPASVQEANGDAARRMSAIPTRSELVERVTKAERLLREQKSTIRENESNLHRVGVLGGDLINVRDMLERELEDLRAAAKEERDEFLKRIRDLREENARLESELDSFRPSVSHNRRSSNSLSFNANSLSSSSLLGSSLTDTSMVLEFEQLTQKCDGYRTHVKELRAENERLHADLDAWKRGLARRRLAPESMTFEEHLTEFFPSEDDQAEFVGNDPDRDFTTFLRLVRRERREAQLREARLKDECDKTASELEDSRVRVDTLKLLEPKCANAMASNKQLRKDVRALEHRIADMENENKSSIDIAIQRTRADRQLMIDSLAKRLHALKWAEDVLTARQFFEQRSHSTPIAPSQTHHGAHPPLSPTLFTPNGRKMPPRGHTDEVTTGHALAHYGRAQLSHASVRSTSGVSSLSRAKSLESGAGSSTSGGLQGTSAEYETGDNSCPFLMRRHSSGLLLPVCSVCNDQFASFASGVTKQPSTSSTPKTATSRSDEDTIATLKEAHAAKLSALRVQHSQELDNASTAAEREFRDRLVIELAQQKAEILATLQRQMSTSGDQGGGQVSLGEPINLSHMLSFAALSPSQLNARRKSSSRPRVLTFPEMIKIGDQLKAAEENEGAAAAAASRHERTSRALLSPPISAPSSPRSSHARTTLSEQLGALDSFRALSEKSHRMAKQASSSRASPATDSSKDESSPSSTAVANSAAGENGSSVANSATESVNGEKVASGTKESLETTQGTSMQSNEKVVAPDSSASEAKATSDGKAPDDGSAIATSPRVVESHFDASRASEHDEMPFDEYLTSLEDVAHKDDGGGKRTDTHFIDPLGGTMRARRSRSNSMSTIGDDNQQEMVVILRPRNNKALRRLCVILRDQFELGDSLVNEGVKPRKWERDADHSACLACTKPFTLFRRRHHCRLCGFIFCALCSSNTTPIGDSKSPHKSRAGRVCDRCFTVVSSVDPKFKHTRKLKLPLEAHRSPATNKFNTPRTVTIDP